MIGFEYFRRSISNDDSYKTYINRDITYQNQYPYISITSRQLFIFERLPGPALHPPAVSGAAERCAGPSCFKSSWTLCWTQLLQERLDAVLAPAVSGAAGRCAGSSCFRGSWTLCWLQLFQEQLDAVLGQHLRGLCHRCGKDRQVVWTLAAQPRAHFRTQQGRNSAREDSQHQQLLNLN
jgi:hypothetical protein